MIIRLASQGGINRRYPSILRFRILRRIVLGRESILTGVVLICHNLLILVRLSKEKVVRMKIRIVT